jgi:hypothetical protein
MPYSLSTSPSPIVLFNGSKSVELRRCMKASSDEYCFLPYITISEYIAAIHSTKKLI